MDPLFRVADRFLWNVASSVEHLMTLTALQRQSTQFALEESENSISLGSDKAWAYFNRAEAYANHADQVNAVENYTLAHTKKRPKLTSLKRDTRKK